ncbi:MAG: D-Ala-D-Ala carboxypeptidase family metallohydrolase, partial [Faecousia sp.]
FASPALPSSGVRCAEHNRKVGGVWNSYHLAGKALDFRIQGRTAAEVLAYVQTLPINFAYAIDERYVHMDVK